MHHPLDNDIVILAIARVVPVINQRSKHGTGLPPKVRCRQIAWYVTRSVAGVKRHHPMGRC